MKNKLANVKSFLEIKNKAENNVKVSIYGYIGGWKNSSENILEKLENIQADVINVHINSGGGSAFDGIAISNILKSHKAKIVVHIDGWAASAASIIAMGGDEIIMPSNTMLMIHNASTFAYGNASEFAKISNDLKKIDVAVKNSYKSRFVGKEEDLTRLLDDETWLNANEALALGFVDKVTDEIEYNEPTEEDEETETEDFKENLVAKYTKKETDQPVNNNWLF